MLRGDLGFDGLVVSDDLGSARQVSAWSAGERALRFLGAGGDLVLTVDPGTVPAMYGAVLGRARRDPDFRDRV
jgi:beta-N-acetylhexosaminidase